MATLAHVPPNGKWYTMPFMREPEDRPVAGYRVHWADREILRHCVLIMDRGPMDDGTRRLMVRCLGGILDRMTEVTDAKEAV